MASPELIRRALLAIFTKLDKNAKRPIRGPGIETPSVMEQDAAASRIPDAIQRKHATDNINRSSDPDFSPNLETLEEKGLNQHQRAFIEQSNLEQQDIKAATSGIFKEPLRKPENLGQEIFDEIRPRDRVRKDNRLDIDLEGEKFTEQVENVKRKMLEFAEDPNTPQVTPALEKDVTRRLARQEIGKGDVDRLAKELFRQLDDLQGTLKLSKSSSQAERAQLGASKKQLLAFRTRAAKAAERAREGGDVTELQALIDRLAK